MAAATAALTVAALALALGSPLRRAEAASPPGNGSGTGSSTGPAPDEVTRTYLRDCAVCHGNTGEGTERGPRIADVGTASVDYELTTGRMPLADPKDTPARSTPRYAPDMTQALVALVGSFGRGGVPVPDTDISSADVVRGGDLYRENCAACHQAIGSGGALYRREAPSLRASTAVQVAEAVRVGPGEMPAFGPSALNDDDVRDVAGYVVDVLHHPDDRGGLSIGRLGTVHEGAVAIFAGLGLLVLFSVWIEGRARRTSRGS